MSEDPTPGDPELIRGVLQRYSDIGDAAEKALNILKKDGAVAGGRGAAMDALREKIGEDLPDKLTKTATSYHDAAAAYRTYIPLLQEAQDTFDRAVEMARSAAPQANLAPPILAPDATDEQKAAANKTKAAIDAGAEQLSAAKGLAEQAQGMRQSAQRSCADVLDRAAGAAIPERNIFQKIADFFHDFPFVEILLGVLIAVVSVFFPVVGLLLGAALFAVVAISQIASGQFDLAGLLIGLIGLIPGAALVKLAGPLVKAGAGAVSKLASNVAKNVQGTITGIRSSFNSRRTVGPLTDSDAARSTDSLLGAAGGGVSRPGSAGSGGSSRGGLDPAGSTSPPRSPEPTPRSPDDNTPEVNPNPTPTTAGPPREHFRVDGPDGDNLQKFDYVDDVLGELGQNKTALVRTEKVPEPFQHLRKRPDPERLERIQNAFDSGTALPPVVLDFNADGLQITDGNHRVFEAKRRGMPFIPIRFES